MINASVVLSSFVDRKYRYAANRKWPREASRRVVRHVSVSVYVWVRTAAAT